MKCIQRCFKIFSGQRLILIFISVLVIFMCFTILTYYNVSRNVDLKKTPSFTRKLDLTLDSTSNARTNRILSYCNSAHNINVLDESNIGEQLDSQFTLNKVIVIIRHGDRGPLRQVRDLTDIDCDPSSVYSPQSQEGKHLRTLDRFVSDAKMRLPRQSYSIPYELFPPNKKACNVGHLTHYGVLQHLTLGDLFNKLYAHQLPPKLVRAYTTQYPRTFQSAVAFLYGFLKPKSNLDFKNFPQIRPTNGIFFCGRQESCGKCNKMDKLNQKIALLKRDILDSHPAIVQLLSKLRPILAPAGNVTSLFQTPVAIFDSLMSYVCHHHELPCDEQKNCIELEQIRQLVAYIDYQGKQLMNSDSFKHVSWLKVIGFFHELVRHLNNSESSRKSSVTLFSAHDLTLVAIAAALDFFDGSLPPYASRITLEVYSNNTDLSKHFRILYNGKDVTRLTDICKSNACLSSHRYAKYQLISVQLFSQYIINKFQSITKADNYSMACKV